VTYIGTVSRSRFLPELIISKEKIDDVRFVIAGKKEGLYEQVKSMSKHIKNIDFLGTIPLQEVVPLTLESHVVLCLFDPSNHLNQIGSPNKLFEAMVCGRPVIASKKTYSGKLVEELHIGIAIDYSEKSLIQTVKKLKNNPDLCEELGRNALKAALRDYNWSHQEKKLLEVYEKLNNR
jgi:glycosyltransferase involved in cell wall biosynthesis